MGQLGKSFIPMMWISIGARNNACSLDFTPRNWHGCESDTLNEEAAGQRCFGLFGRPDWTYATNTKRWNLDRGLRLMDKLMDVMDRRKDGWLAGWLGEVKEQVRASAIAGAWDWQCPTIKPHGA